MLALGVLFSSPSAEDVRNVVAKTFENDAYQRDYVELEAPESRELPSVDIDPPDVSGVAVVIRALMWIGLAVVVVLVLMWVVQNVADPRGPPVEMDPAGPVAAAVVLTDEPLEDATALAAQGRYGDAIHALLLRTLAILSEEQTLPRSWTSREIVARTGLSETVQRGVVDLVDATEISLFGGRDAELEDYQQCVQTFRRLQDLLQRESA